MTLRPIRLAAFAALAISASFLSSTAFASGDPLPIRDGVYALTNCTLVTITNGVIENGTLVIRDGVIEAVGSSATPPDDAEVIDCAGASVYPGFIDAGTTLGLVEVGSLPETRDAAELGDFTPHMKALTAVNPNSELIATTRVSGVTTVLTVPSNGLLPGTAALINLHGYTPEQMYAGFEAVALNFPATGRRGFWDRRTDEEIRKEAEKAMERLDETWTQARLFARIDSAYQASPDPAPTPPYNPAMRALLPVIRGQAPLLIEVDAAKDIQAALKWVRDRHIRAIFTGLQEGWRVADEIAAAGIPCLVGPVLTTPSRASDRYDKPYANAGLMARAGVKIALRTSEDSNVRNLPYHAGFAAAYGLGRESALRAVTIHAAQIFGVDDRMGSLERGKSATLFIADGDPFEPATQIRRVFIDGYPVPMNDRQKRLYEEFLERNPGLAK